MDGPGWQGQRAARDYVLETSRVVIAWDQFGDLNAHRDWDQLAELVRDDYAAGDRPKATATKHTKEIFAFLNDIEIGDIVVTPIDHDTAAVGEITGNYGYDAAAPEGCHHYRTVRWIDTAVPRARFGSEFQSTLKCSGDGAAVSGSAGGP